MKWLLIIGLISFVYCSDQNEQEYKNEERRVVGGGNYGGFIGLTTYGGGPFLVKGKYERDNYGGYGPNWEGFRPGLKQGQYYGDGQRDYNKDDKYRDDDKNKKDAKYNDGVYDAKLISNVGYEDIQKDQLYYEDQRRGGYKKDDDYFEYLGYRGGYGNCIGYYRERDGYNRDRDGYNRDRDGYYRDRDGYEYRDQYGRQRYRYRDDNGQSRLNSNFSNYYDDETRDRCDYLFGYTGPTANDGPENIMRPCALDDWQCIRKYFAANAKCKPAYGPIPDPLYIGIETVFYPIVNVTVALTNLEIRGLSSAKIREFYINKKSGNLVFAIDVSDLNQTSPRAYVRYRRTAKESIVLADFAIALYGAVTFTAIIPKVPNLRLDFAEIHADIQNPVPPMNVGPGAYKSTDPDVLSAYAQFNLLTPFVARESMTFNAQIVTAIFIQENICDFGLKIISV